MKADFTNTLSAEKDRVEKGEVCDPSDLSFIRVKGQIGIQLSVELLNRSPRLTLCATRMTRVTLVNTDSYIILHTDFYLMGAEEIKFIFVICHHVLHCLFQTIKV